MARAVGGYVNVATLVHSGAPFLFERPPDALSTGCRQEGWGNGVHRHEHTGGRRRKQACTHMRARARALCQAFGSRAHRVGHRDGQPTVIRELHKAAVTAVVVVVIVVIVVVIGQRLVVRDVVRVVVLGAIFSGSRSECKRLRSAQCHIFFESFVEDNRGGDSCRGGR